MRSVHIKNLVHDSYLVAVWDGTNRNEVYSLARVDRLTKKPGYSWGTIWLCARWDNAGKACSPRSGCDDIWINDPMISHVILPGTPHHTALVAIEMAVRHGAKHVQLPADLRVDTPEL